MSKKHIIVVAVIVIVAAGAGFFGGIKYQQAKVASAFKSGNFAAGNRTGMFQQGATGARRAGGQGMGGQFITGQVISKDDKSITVKVGDTGSKIIFYSNSTSIGKTTSGTASDIAVGQEIMASGTSNSDGSVTAQNIQIRPGIASSTPPTK
ncbi:MAG: hypothetical protein HY918_03500 [Candidatus Doudnabacteria bacterium]|nr:hypothetical protein [Candidatus Doudnabacteria bacterium]